MGNRTKDLRLLRRCHVDGYALPSHGVLKSLTIPRTQLAFALKGMDLCARVRKQKQFIIMIETVQAGGK